MNKSAFILVLFLSHFCSAQWEEINNPSTGRINDLYFVTENIGWIITDYDVYKTMDGGVSWEKQSLPPIPEGLGRDLSSIEFFDENIGMIGCGTYWLTGDEEFAVPIFWTVDAGENWIAKDVGETNFNLDAIFVDSETAYTIAQYGECRKTSDGGETWSDLPYLGVYSGVNLFAISEDTIYFAGNHQFDLKGAFGFTTDGGENWTETTISENGLMKAMFFHNSNSGCIGGFDGEIKFTKDGGQTWTPANTGITSVVNDITFLDPQNGWAVTSDGEILKSEDIGQSWEIEHDGNLYLEAIQITKPNGIGYAAGADIILKSKVSSSTEESKLNENITIYPNPFDSKLIVNFPENQNHSAQLSIYNILGELIYTSEFTGDKTIVNTRSFSPGTYILKVKNNKEKIIKTVIKL